MTTATSSNGQRRFGPYSRAIQRGVVSDVIDGRSREGKYLRRIEAELAAQLGGSPSFAQKLLIRRISRMMLRLEEFDRKLDAAAAYRPGREGDGRPAECGPTQPARPRPQAAGPASPEPEGHPGEAWGAPP